MMRECEGFYKDNVQLSSSNLKTPSVLSYDSKASNKNFNDAEIRRTNNAKRTERTESLEKRS